MTKNLIPDNTPPALPKFEVQDGSLAKKPLPDDAPWLETMGKALGLKDPDLVVTVIDQLVSATSRLSPENCIQINAAIAAVGEVIPEDSVETMLASQMVVCNTAVMELMKKVTTSGFSEESVRLYLKTVDKLLKTYTRQMEALSKYRRKGRQKMTVEHVTIENGGQAVIGNITRKGVGS